MKTTVHTAAAALLVAAACSVAAHAATVYTGDVIQGKRVISQLDVADLEPGKRVLLVSGVHGDEVSPVDAVQRTMAQLDPAQMSGTVTAVYDVSRPAKEGVTRMWPLAQWGGQLIDLNRVWPGDESGGNAPTRHAGLVFNRLFKPNADVALDFHTIRATHGGFLELLIDLRDKVAQGQTVAIQRNSFGEVIREYTSEVAGEVSTLQRDAMTEPGRA